PTDLGGGRCVPLGSGQGFICKVVLNAASPFAGSSSEAYRRLESNDFRSYSFGLQFQMPLSNALARSELTQSRIARSQAELNHRQLLSNVTLEVRRSAADVTSGRQRIDTTRVARELAEENLRNQEKRHEVGMATTNDLLDFQPRPRTTRPPELLAHVAEELVLRGPRGAQLDDADHRLTPLLVRDPDDDRVVHGRMGLQDLLDLLRVDLLAAGVDADAAAPEERQRAVRFHAA